jgi:hypothetical protein
MTKDEIVALYKSGLTLGQIGARAGVTRQRIHQIIKKLGIDSQSGGRAVQALNRKEARSIKLHSVGTELYKVLKANGATAAYTRQRENAKKRGIGWNFILADWWQIWYESGKWSKRGRGHGRYVMARFGDKGPYEVDNVKIIPADENNSEQWINRRDSDENISVAGWYP